MASTRMWQPAIVLGAALSLLTPGVPATAAPTAPAATDARAAAAPTAPAGAAKVAPAVRARLAAAGKGTFWVVLAGKANLAAAQAALAKPAKGTAVYRAETEFAKGSQAGVRKLLDTMRTDYTAYWISNTIKVTGDAKLLDLLAARPEVTSVHADTPSPLIKPVATRLAAKAKVAGVEWNVDKIGAPRVWSELGVRGEGIVVASVDSGVDWEHPALRSSYRGRTADGIVNHDYNWFDPSHVCPTAEPCDTEAHGTHTMGTMVGDDGTNRIGVAPGARWISAKGCESDTCSESALLAAGQWIVAPTRVNGTDPRPDLAPDVVNNSWASSDQDTWYKDVVSSWVAAGIFPSFANGNSGPRCDSTSAPGSYTNSYSSGASDSSDTIAGFSSRGLGEDGAIKPNITAPGLDVRSSVPGGFDVYSGTSMAAPHTSATVALIWSASRALRGHIDDTRALLDRTALDVEDTDCPGGTPGDNLTYGEGRLDAYAAVAAAPHGPIGGVSGTVTAEGQPLAAATVTLTGPDVRTIATGADGSFALPRLAVGDYAVTAAKFGYRPATGAVTITDGGTASVALDLVRAPTATLSGTVSWEGEPVAGASVELLSTPLSAHTDAQGRYSLVVPQGGYDVRTVPGVRCAEPVTTHVSVAGDTTHDIAVPPRTDGFGYACGHGTAPYPTLTSKLDLSGDDATKAVDLPFPVPFYGATHRTATISTNGAVYFGNGATTTGANTTLPNTSLPNDAIYAFWDDLKVDGDAAIYTGVVGSTPGHRAYAIEWRDVAHYLDPDQRLSFVVLIGEDGTIEYRYKDVAGTGLEAGNSATIGLENAAGTVAYLYSDSEPVVSDGLAIAFHTTRTGVVRGTVTDATDGRALGGAAVTVRAGGQVIATTVSDPGGAYLAQVGAGAVTVEVASPRYETATTAVTVAVGAVTTANIALRTARVAASPASLEIVAAAGGSRTRTVDLTNTGALPATYALAEATADGPADVPWLAVLGGGGTLSPGQHASVLLTVSTAGLAPGTHQTAYLQITSNSGRVPVLDVPIHLVVPGFQAALDAGSAHGHVDLLGDAWQPDAAQKAGGCGYLGASSVLSTRKPITGTTDETRLADARQGMYEYRCDGVPAGVYTVELDFAELKAAKPNTRVFDVLLEAALVLPSLDIALEAGSFTAVSRRYEVRVTDGQLNLRFVTHTGFGKPLVNGVRFTQRPDL